jgi:Zn-dependent protease with chaperone function
MRVVALGLLAFGGYALAFYTVAGWWASVRFRDGGDPEDRFLSRAIYRAHGLFLAGTALLVWWSCHSPPRVGAVIAIVSVYAFPLLWAWVVVLGSSWIEMRARGLGLGLWRFHRFNLFAGFMLWGQRLPFYSAAVVAPRLVLLGADPAPTLALHLALAVAVGWAARWVLVRRVVGVRSFPDPRLAVEVRAAARNAGIRLRGALLVPTEPGQSLNALVATSSRIIYVAEGLWRGLGREELRGVLLHEVGHLGQPVTNVFRNLAVLGWPAIIAAGQVAGSRAVSDLRAVAALFLLILLGVAGSQLTRMVQQEAETGADLFAAEMGSRAALMSALRKLYSGDFTPPAGRRKPERVERRIQERLRVLKG